MISEQWVCDSCGRSIPAGPVIPRPADPTRGFGTCYGCGDPTSWTRSAPGPDTALLTPVRPVPGGAWAKRDDLFEVAGVTGGKARSCFAIARTARKGLVTAGSRSSPQVNIVARIGRLLSLPVRAHVPGGPETPELALAAAAGAEVVPVYPGYNSVITAAAARDAEQRGWTLVPFGMECGEAIAQTAAQVENLPQGAERVVVPVGSGMSLAGILTGMGQFGLRLPVVGVVVGADPTRRLDRWAPPWWRTQVELVPSGSDYHRPAQDAVWRGLSLDPHYEAKAAPFVRKGDVLWVVGIRQSAGDPS
jgi:hypothetical protein